jgi:hypothetical protein
VHACYFQRARDANRWMDYEIHLQRALRGEREREDDTISMWYKKVRSISSHARRETAIDLASQLFFGKNAYQCGGVKRRR